VQGAASESLYGTDARDLQNGAEASGIRDEIASLHATIRTGQERPAPEGPATKRASRIAVIALVVALALGIPTLYFTAYPVVKDWLHDQAIVPTLVPHTSRSSTERAAQPKKPTSTESQRTEKR